MEGFGVAEAAGATDGFGVGVGVGDGDGEGEGEGDGLGEGVKITDGEGEGWLVCSALYDLKAAKPAKPVKTTKAKTIGIEIIPELFNFILGIAFNIIRINIPNGIGC